MSNKVNKGIFSTLFIMLSILTYSSLDKMLAAKAYEESLMIKEESIPRNEEYIVNEVIDYGGNESINYDDLKLYPSGEPIGIYVKASGVLVTEVCQIENKYGDIEAPCQGIVFEGDYIESINGKEIEDKEDLIDAVNMDSGQGFDVSIRRNDRHINTHLFPEISKSGNNMLGLMVKDDISGIGTLTFISDSGFGALGHSINDTDTRQILSISDGAIYGVNLINVVKAGNNKPGRLEGIIDYSKSNVLGRIEENSIYGIKGHLTKNGRNNISLDEFIPIARKSEVKMGRAYIKSAISGQSRLYEIEIVSLNPYTSDGLKGIEVRIVDRELLSRTNGIVQGMSGSPIIQDGKLVGAITHVFLGDSSRGYGIFIEEMLDN